MTERILGLVAVLLLAGCGAAKEDSANPFSMPEMANATQDPGGLPDVVSVAVAEKAPATEPVACRSDEATVFSCKVENGKHLAVCAGDAGVEYRFGGDTPELRLTGGHWASVAYSGGGEAQIAFDSDDARFVVFSRMIRTNFEPDEPNYPALSDGVVVLNGDDVVAFHQCDDPDGLPIQHEHTAGLLSVSNGLFTYETARADER